MASMFVPLMTSYKYQNFVIYNVMLFVQNLLSQNLPLVIIT
jgi:hypothetical protein